MKNLILILSIICLLCSCGVENNVVEFIIGNPPNNFYCFNVMYQTNLRKEDEKEFMEVLTETLRKEYIRISKDYIGISEHTILRKFISNLDHYTFEFKGYQVTIKRDFFKETDIRNIYSGEYNQKGNYGSRRSNGDSGSGFSAVGYSMGNSLGGASGAALGGILGGLL